MNEQELVRKAAEFLVQHGIEPGAFKKVVVVSREMLKQMADELEMPEKSLREYYAVNFKSKKNDNGHIVIIYKDDGTCELTDTL